MKKYQGYIVVLFSALLFGIGTTINKITLSTIHPLVIASVTYLFAGIILAILRFVPFFKNLLNQYILKIENTSLNRNAWLYMLLIALCGAAIAPFLFLNGLKNTTAINGSLLMNVEILFTILFALVFLKEKATKKEYFVMFLLFLTAIVVTTNLDFIGLSISEKIFGNLFIIGATFFWALDNSFSKKLSIKYDCIKIAIYKLLIGGLITMSIILMLQIPFNITLIQIPYLIYIGFFSNGISLVLFLLGLRIIGSMKTIVVFSTSSLFGVITAFVVLHEPISVIQICAGILMMYAVYLMSKETALPSKV